MQKVNTVLALVAFNYILCANAFGQTQITTISSIFDNPIEGQKVTLRGKIIEHQQNETDSVVRNRTPRA